MVELTNIQHEIWERLVKAIGKSNFNEVKEILKGDDNDIQGVLRFYWVGTRLNIFVYAIIILNIRSNSATGVREEKVKIIELIWERANQATRDILCDLEPKENFTTIDVLRELQGKVNSTEISNTLEEVIQKMEDHKRIRNFDYNLREAIRSLNVNQVKAALKHCGEDVKSVLERQVYWDNGNVDTLLFYPLMINYKRNLDKKEFEKIKESFKLMLGYASPWLRRFEICKEDGAPSVNYVIDRLAFVQEHFAKIPGVGEQYFQDLIQEFEEKLSKDTLDNAKADDQIAWDKEYATRFSQQINHDLFENDELNACIDGTDLGQNPVINTANPELINESDLPGNNPPVVPATTDTGDVSATSNTPPAPTADNKTPEKNDITFWSEHKGKIALGVTGLCVAGAVAAYVLAYPAVALALAVLAAVILIGAVIAKVCEKVEDPSVEKLFTQQQEV